MYGNGDFSKSYCKYLKGDGHLPHLVQAELGGVLELKTRDRCVIISSVREQGRDLSSVFWEVNIKKGYRTSSRCHDCALTLRKERERLRAVELAVVSVHYGEQRMRARF